MPNRLPWEVQRGLNVEEALDALRDEIAPKILALAKVIRTLEAEAELLEEHARVSDGAGPRQFVFHPNNRLVYLLNELEASLYVFAYDAETGTISERQVTSALPPNFSGPRLGMQGNSTNGGPKAADIHVSPDGRFIYASERTTSRSPPSRSILIPADLRPSTAFRRRRRRAVLTSTRPAVTSWPPAKRPTI
jgi:hypothetical protein